MVEHSAVNRRVAGSSPARGAESEKPVLWTGFFVLNNLTHCIQLAWASDMFVAKV